MGLRTSLLFAALFFSLLIPSTTQASVQTALSYDYLGRVIQVTEQGQTEDYFYSGEKRVFKKEASGKKRLYLFEDHSVVFDREVEFGKRGDSDGTGTWTITDAVYLINYIFADGPSPKPNVLAGDADGNSIITIGDAVWLINFIFTGGPAPSSATLSLPGAANVFAPGAGRLWSDGAMGTEDLYFVEDSVSSTSAVLSGNALGEVIHSTPFGEQLTTSNLEKRYLFTGKELDASTGLFYFGARYYDPALGRFLQWDSVMDGHNRYLYVRNNPINANDPSGHEGGFPTAMTFLESAWSSFKDGVSDFLHTPVGTPLFQLFPGVRDGLDSLQGQFAMASEYGDMRTRIGGAVGSRLVGALSGMFFARPEEMVDLNDPQSLGEWAIGFAGSLEMPRYPSFPMKGCFRKGGDMFLAESQVRYLMQDSEREFYELSVRGGRLYDSNGQLFHTYERELYVGRTDQALSVMDSRGRIFAASEYEFGEFHHSSFLAGGDVSWAGMISSERGYLKSVMNQSGHYQLDDAANAHFIQELMARRANLENTLIFNVRSDVMQTWRDWVGQGQR